MTYFLIVITPLSLDLFIGAVFKLVIHYRSLNRCLVCYYIKTIAIENQRMFSVSLTIYLCDFPPSFDILLLVPESHYVRAFITMMLYH